MKKDKNMDELLCLRKKIREQAVQLQEVKAAAGEAIKQTSCALDAVLAEVAIQFGKVEIDGEERCWKFELPIPNAVRYRVAVARDKLAERYCITVTENLPKKDIQEKQ